MPDASDLPPTRHRAVRLDPDLDRELETIAALRFSTPSQVLREALGDYARRWRATQRRIERSERVAGAGQ